MLEVLHAAPFASEEPSGDPGVLRRSVLASLLALPGTALGSRLQAATLWQVATEYPADTMPGEGVIRFARNASAAAAAALTVQPQFDAPDGLRSAGMIAAVARGWPAAGDAFTGALASVAPIFQLSALPFLTASAADAARLLQVARPAYREALQARSCTLLYATPWPATGLWSRQALDGPQALHGLRVRTYDSVGTSTFRAAGADPVQISFADALPRLRAGALDAVLSSGDGGAGVRLWELLPHFTPIEYAWPLSLAFCNTATLAALPASMREAVLRAGTETEAQQFEAIVTRSRENAERMRDNGVRVSAIPTLRTALVDAATQVLAEWRTQAGADGAAILAAYGAAPT
ncbi:MAG: TRAP transporter substrate-binding protein DctP [Janthinobacterium lividum]